MTSVMRSGGFLEGATSYWCKDRAMETSMSNLDRHAKLKNEQRPWLYEMPTSRITKTRSRHHVSEKGRELGSEAGGIETASILQS